jgi:TolA-binding protein
VLYDAALELIRSHQWELGIEQMQSVIDRFPDGKLTPNAYYWLGEAYTIKPEADYEKARKNLSQVITYFPDHDKRPHAEFKLGMVYHLMGDCVPAGDLLKQVVDQQQGKSVAKYAEDYLRKKVGNCE